MIIFKDIFSSKPIIFRVKRLKVLKLAIFKLTNEINKEEPNWLRIIASIVESDLDILQAT